MRREWLGGRIEVNNHAKGRPHLMLGLSVGKNDTWLQVTLGWYTLNVGTLPESKDYSWYAESGFPYGDECPGDCPECVSEREGEFDLGLEPSDLP